MAFEEPGAALSHLGARVSTLQGAYIHDGEREIRAEKIKRWIHIFT